MTFARTSLGLHAMVHGAGYEKQTSPSYDWHGLRRGPGEFALFQYTLGGQGSLIYEGTPMTVAPGHVMLLHFPHDHRYFLPADGKWEFFWIVLNGGIVVRTWQAAVRRLGPVVKLSPQSELLRTAQALCASVLQSRVQTPWQASARAYELTMALASEAFPGEQARSRSQRSPAVQRAMDLARVVTPQPVRVEQMAAAAGYSRHHFSRLFRASEGITPEQYLIQQRLRQAARLLQTTTAPLKVIGPQCGFADVAYFSRAFRKGFGMWPGAFRQAAMDRG